MMTVFKVVREIEGKYFSVISSRIIEYTLNKWVQPEVGKVFAFDGLERALSFCSYQGSSCIFEAEAEESLVQPDFCLFPNLVKSNRILRFFWGSIGTNTRMPHICTVGTPIGTVLCDRIMLISKRYHKRD